MYTTSTYYTYHITDIETVKQKVLNWLQRFSTFCFLDNHAYQVLPHNTECLVAAGIKREIKLNSGNALSQLQHFISERRSWLFGHLGYDLKNETARLHSGNFDGIQFPDLYFFEPEIIIRIKGQELIILADEPQKVFAEIDAATVAVERSTRVPSIQGRFSKEEYISTIRQLRQHILRGDCYEINFCQEFYAEQCEIDPFKVYRQLSKISPNPFSALYKIGDRWLICASPERFLLKQGSKILTQPIKGTSQRNLLNKDEDEKSKIALRNSAKDQSENVMIVDLMRNDLSRICKDGTVKVDELFGIYSFPQVHQMISTVSGELKDNISFSDIVRATFPMGSMTGAPKKRVMELIEQYEETRRGIFSGSVGYLTPEGDFDLNVVIRSIMYNEETKYLSYQVGSGITYNSVPENEWEECLMKVEGIKKVLGSLQ